MEDCNNKPNEGITIITVELDIDHEAGQVEEASKKRKVLVDNGVVGEPRAAHSSAAVGLLGRRSSAVLGVDSSSEVKSSAGVDENDGASSGLAAAAAEEESSSSSSCCSSNESSDVVKDSLRLVDLEAKSNYESEKIAHSTSLNNKNNKFRRETTPSSELCVDSEEITGMASPTKRKFPPREEIEEFFAEAEKSDQKRFSEKYNYDIVKDLPLEGRYQWVSLKP